MKGGNKVKHKGDILRVPIIDRTQGISRRSMEMKKIR
jgi:hypothetical protein